MARRKLRLEVQQSNEQGVCVNPTVPRWYGQDSITTSDITGSVMKILITDSNGQQISITIGSNGSIQRVIKNGENEDDRRHDLQIEKRLNTNEMTWLPCIVNNQQSTIEIPNSDLVSVKEELKEYEEEPDTGTGSSISVKEELKEYEEEPDTGTGSSISFKEVIGVISEGYKLEPLEPEVEEVFHTEWERIKSEEPDPAVKDETVDIGSEILLPENDETPRVEESSEMPDSINQSTNDITSLCRLCATQQKDMIYIFIPNEAHENITEQIQDCLPILVRDTDTLPKQVCRLCLEKLEMFHKFYKTVLEAERQLNILSEKISEELRIAKNIDETLPPQIVEPAGEKSSKELVSDEESSISHNLCSLPLLESPRLLHSEKDLGYKKKKDGDIIFMRDSASPNDFAEGTDIIKCLLCGLYFGSAKGCYMHASIHYTENCFPCNMCDKIYENALESRKHSEQHMNPRKVREQSPIPKINTSSCILRSTLINGEDNSDDNIIRDREAVKDRTYVEKIDKDIIKCRICCRYFSSVQSCYRHSSEHASENFWPCSICSRISPNAKESWEHSLEHLVRKTPHQKAAKRVKTPIDINPGSQPVMKTKILPKSMVVIVRKDKTDDSINPGEETVDNEASIEKSDSDCMVKCRICGVTFPDTKSCYIHAIVHLKEDYYPCTMCYTSFKTRKKLWRHALKHMENKYKDKKLCIYVCNTCGKKFATEDRLRFHEIYHNPNVRPCYCELCSTLLASESSLYHHTLKVHERSKNSNKLELESHQVEHTNKHFGCPVCNKYFSSNDELKLHIQLHSGYVKRRRKIFCYYCGKRFAQKSSLSVHIALEHTGEYPYSIFSQTYIYVSNEFEDEDEAAVPTNGGILNTITEAEKEKNLNTKKRTIDYSLYSESYEAKKTKTDNTNDKKC